MKRDYLQQIENSARFLNTEIFRIYYSRIPKEVDMNAKSTHVSHLYVESDIQPHTDNFGETQGPSPVARLNQSEEKNDSSVNSPIVNSNETPNREQPVDTIPDSNEEPPVYSAANQEAVSENDHERIHSDHSVTEPVSLHLKEKTETQNVPDNHTLTSFDEITRDHQTVAQSDTSIRTDEIKAPEEPVWYDNVPSAFEQVTSSQQDSTTEVATEVTETAETTPLKPGAWLRSEREKQKFSDQYIADRLYLDVNLIKALEADDYDRLPPAIFVRGYIRNYAKLLGIAAEPILASYESVGSATTSTPNVTPQLKPKKQTNSGDLWFKVITSIIIISLMILMALWQFYPSSVSNSPQVISTPDAPTWEDFQPLETQPTYPSVVEEVNPNANLDQPESSVAATTESEIKLVEAKPEQTMPEETTPPPVSPEPQAQSIKMHFNQKVWVQLIDSKGKILYNKIGNSGEVLSIEDGIPPFYISVGNPGLQVEYQGELKKITAYPKQQGKRMTFIIGGEE